MALNHVPAAQFPEHTGFNMLEIPILYHFCTDFSTFRAVESSFGRWRLPGLAAGQSARRPALAPVATPPHPTRGDQRGSRWPGSLLRASTRPRRGSQAVSRRSRGARFPGGLLQDACRAAGASAGQDQGRHTPISSAVRLGTSESEAILGSAGATLRASICHQ